MKASLIFSITSMGSYVPKKIVVVNESVIVLDICTKLKGSPDSAAGSTLF